MKTFFQFLYENDISWQAGLFTQLFLYPQGKVENGKNVSAVIPLSMKMIEDTLGSVQVTAAHIADFDRIVKLFSIQNKRTKQISTYTATEMGDELYQTGVNSGGGIVAIVHGTVVASGRSDIMSVPDKQGTRMIDIGKGSEFSYMMMGNDDLASFQKEIIKMREKIENDTIQKHEEFQGMKIFASLALINREYPKLKFEMIKQYYDGIKKIINADKEGFGRLLLDYGRGQGTSKRRTQAKSGWDELVLSSFKILKLIVSTNEYSEDSEQAKELRKYKVPIEFTKGTSGMRDAVNTELNKRNKN